MPKPSRGWRLRERKDDIQANTRPGGVWAEGGHCLCYLLLHLFSKLQLVQLLLLGCSRLRVSLGEVLLLEVAKWGEEH